MIPVDSAELREEVYRLRYEVYCKEFGFEDPLDHPSGLEMDADDERSIHCLLLHRPSGQYSGCLRLILDRPGGPRGAFPFERACGTSLESDVARLVARDRSTSGEISRLAVPAGFRRRRGEAAAEVPPLVGAEPRSARAALNPRQRRFPYNAVGLYLGGAALGMLNGLNNVFVMMEPRLARHLRIYGIRFRQVGDVIDYHGMRGPFQIDRELFDGGLGPEMRGIFEHIVDELGMAQAVSA